MDVALFFILPTVGGYLLAHSWNFTKFRSLREEGHRLYFRAVFFGALLFSIAWVVTQTFRSHWPEYVVFENSVVAYLKPLITDRNSNGVPLPDAEVTKSTLIAITAMYALLLGCFAGYPLNLLFWSKHALRAAVSDNDFEQLILQAALRLMPVCITMETSRVYVGWVTGTVDPTQPRRYVEILPLMSGYCDSKGEITFTTFYATVYEKIGKKGSGLNHLSPGDFQKILPSDKLASINLFDMEAYEIFQKRRLNERLTNKRKKKVQNRHQ